MKRRKDLLFHINTGSDLHKWVKPNWGKTQQQQSRFTSWERSRTSILWHFSISAPALCVLWPNVVLFCAIIANLLVFLISISFYDFSFIFVFFVSHPLGWSVTGNDGCVPCLSLSFPTRSCFLIRRGDPSHSVNWGKRFITKDKVIYILLYCQWQWYAYYEWDHGDCQQSFTEIHFYTHARVHLTDMHSKHLRMYFSRINLHAYSIWFKKPTKEATIIMSFLWLLLWLLLVLYWWVSFFILKTKKGFKTIVLFKVYFAFFFIFRFGCEK